MRAISSLQDITMRVLVLSALIACVSAAPCHQQFSPLPLAPLPVTYTAAAVLPTIAVAPTVQPGDIQAAAIDAQVEAEDKARFAADRERELAELAAENQNEGVVEGNDLVKEKSEEAFWAGEEKKWQAVSDAQIAEAKIDASAAANAATIAKSLAVTGVAPAVTGFPAASVVAPGATIESASNDARPEIEVKSAAVTEDKAEEKETVKAAEIEKEVAPKPEVGTVKSDVLEALIAETAALQSKLASTIIPASVAVAPGFPYQPVAAPISYQSALRSFPFNTIPPYPAQLYSFGNGW